MIFEHKRRIDKIFDSEVNMKASKGKSAAVAREVKRRFENILTEEQKVEKVAAKTERYGKIQRTADEKSDKLRGMAERRSTAGIKGLAVEATRISNRRKSQPKTIDDFF